MGLYPTNKAQQKWVFEPISFADSYNFGWSWVLSGYIHTCV